MTPPASPACRSHPPLWGRVFTEPPLKPCKPCLKATRPAQRQCSKSVDFGAQVVEEVYLADVWDRTPMEPAKKLTYQDLLELKEIQNSLPHADQPDDPFCGKSAAHYLSSVPIGLLPLLQDPSDCAPSPSPSSFSPLSADWTAPAPPPAPSISISSAPEQPPPPPPPPPRKPWCPPHLSHLLPTRPQPQRARPTFAFLPLLDTPPSSASPSPLTSNPSSRSTSPDPPTTDTDDTDYDPPTPSLTNASIDSTPPSSTSSSPDRPRFLPLPALTKSQHLHDIDHHHHHHHNHEATGGDDDTHPARNPLLVDDGTGTLVRPSTLFYPAPKSGTTAWSAFPNKVASRESSVSPAASRDSSPLRHPPLPPSPPAPSITPRTKNVKKNKNKKEKKKKKNIMVVNGVEIDIGGDESDDEDNDDEDEDEGVELIASVSISVSTTTTPSPLSVARGRERSSSPICAAGGTRWLLYRERPVRNAAI